MSWWVTRAILASVFQGINHPPPSPHPSHSDHTRTNEDNWFQEYFIVSLIVSKRVCQTHGTDKLTQTLSFYKEIGSMFNRYIVLSSLSSNSVWNEYQCRAGDQFIHNFQPTNLDWSGTTRWWQIVWTCLLLDLISPQRPLEHMEREPLQYILSFWRGLWLC